MYPEDEKISEIEDKQNQVQNAIARSGGRESRAMQRIDEIKGELPSAVFRAAMGDLTADAPDKLRQELATMQSHIEDHVYIVEEGRKATIRLAGEMRKLHIKRGRRVEYDEIKQQVSDDPAKLNSGALTKTGMFLSEALHGDRSDFEQFMASVKEGDAA